MSKIISTKNLCVCTLSDNNQIDVIIANKVTDKLYRDVISNIMYSVDNNRDIFITNVNELNLKIPFILQSSISKIIDETKEEYKMSREVNEGDTFKHFKGNDYKVLMLARDSDTLDEIVIYQDINDETKIWTRKLTDFLEPTDKNKYPDVMQRHRFEKTNTSNN